MKAQSAIEYLITYGWMLIAVAIVSSVIYATFSPSCQEGVSGYIGQEPVVDQFGTGEESMSLALSNPRSEDIKLENIIVSDPDTGVEQNYNFDTVISSGSVEVFESPMSEAGCNTYDLIFTYDISTLQDQRSSGTVTVEGDLLDVTPPPSLQSFDAEY